MNKNVLLFLIFALLAAMLLGCDRKTALTQSQVNTIDSVQDGLGGTDSDENMEYAQIVLADGMSYIVTKMYSLEGAETFEVFLSVMTNTLQLV